MINKYTAYYHLRDRRYLSAELADDSDFFSIRATTQKSAEDKFLQHVRTNGIAIGRWVVLPDIDKDFSPQNTTTNDHS